MRLLLASNRPEVLRRWRLALGEAGHRLLEATGPRDLELHLEGGAAELVLLHRELLDRRGMARLRKAHPRPPWFVLSDRPGREEAWFCLRLGVSGYGNTFMAPPRLLQAVAAIGSGSVWLGQGIVQEIVQALGRSAGQADGEEREPPLRRALSDREYQVAALVVEGLRNAEIGRRLGISERTVKAHLAAIYAKTGCRNKLQLALAWAGRRPS